MRSDRSGRVHNQGDSIRRRGILAAVVLSLSFASPAAKGDADDVLVPIGLQADLLSKVAEYDRNFVERAVDRVHVLLYTKPDNPESRRVAAQLATALSRITTIANLPHDETVVAYTNTADLVEACLSRRAAVVFFGPGFRDDIDQIRTALVGVSVLSVSAVPDYVPRGIVLGFDVQSGRPKLLVHLTQAKLQKVNLRAEALKLMKAYE